MSRGAADRDALALPAGELRAALADARVEAVGQRLDEVGQARAGDRELKLGLAGVGPGDEQVVAD